MNIRSRLSLFLLLGGTAIFCRGSDIWRHTEELEAMISKMMVCHHLPGLAVSVVQGVSVWAKGFGEAVIDNVPFSPDTKVPIGSLADIFTTLLLENVLNDSSRFFFGHPVAWSSPVFRILTDINFSNDSSLTDKLTLEDLASGRTGLSSLPLLWKAGALPKNLTRPDLVRNFYKIHTTDPRSAFRECFESSPFAHGVLGRVTEALGNDRWKNLMQDKILNRMRLEDTGFLGDHQTSITAESGFALPYEYCRDCPSDFQTGFTVDTPLDKYSLPAVYPGNGMVSSVNDMARFLKWFKKNSYTFTQSKTSVLPDHPWVVNFKKPMYPASHTTFNYGKGWFLGQYNGYDVAWNVGKLHNYLTYTAMVKDLDLAMTFFANSAGKDTFSPLLMSYIVDLAAGEPRWLNTSSVCSFPVNRRGRKRFFVPPRYENYDIFIINDIYNVEDNAGTYRDPIFGEITVTKTDEFLNATYGSVTGQIWKTPVREWAFSPPDMDEVFAIIFIKTLKGNKYVHLFEPGYNARMTFSNIANTEYEIMIL